MRNRGTLLRLGLLLCACAPFVVAACGGDDSKKVKYPGKDDAGAEPTSTEVTAGTGSVAPVVGVADTSTSTMSGDAKSAYDDGFKAWMSGDLLAAKQKFRAATSADPKASAAYYSLGCVLERLGDNAGAQTAFRQAFSAKSDDEMAMGAYALNLAHTGHQSEADSFLTQKHQQRPKSARLETYLAEVKSLEKDSADAQRLAQDALRIDPNYKDAMVVIARDHYRAGRTELAKYALQAILEGFGQASPARDPGNAEALLLRGLIEREEGRRIAAMKDFDLARQKRPDLVEATIQVASMKLEAGNAAEAHPLLDMAVKYAPENAIAHMNLGDCYRLEQRWADAKRELERALQLDSTLLGAHYALGLMYLNAPNFPGMDAKSQVNAAIRELEQYKSMRGPKAPPGTSDDIDDLIARAKDKLAQMSMPAPTVAPAATHGKKKP
jgi:tetratricopeptide (TPR) repeat protein